MSTIKVNKLEQRSGCTATVGGGAGKTVVVDATTVTLGRCGGAVNLASGASQTGFGRTGTVDWQTGSIKTSTFTAANGEGYFANTAGGAFTMNLPSGSAGAIVSVVDYTNTFQTNNLTISPNGTDKIAGTNANATLSTEGQSVTFVFVDSTEGWKNTQDSTSNVVGSAFITATGGTITTVCTNFKVHTFTGPGTFAVTGGSGPAATASYLVVAGGGGGGKDRSGGGGAGGYREGKTPATPYTASPIASTSGLTLSPGSYPITIGAGGPGVQAPQPASSDAGTGGVSTFSTITSAGGGRGGSGPGPFSAGGNGGSGGGSDAYGNPSGAPNMAAGSGNTPPVSPPQGNNGGVGVFNSPNGSGRGGGGGGAGAAGTSGTPGGNPGGNGVTSSINNTPTARGGGGGGSNCGSGGVTGGTGGGGKGGCSSTGSGSGSANTGGGGGGGRGCSPYIGGAGGSGIVIIRYKFQ